MTSEYTNQLATYLLVSGLVSVLALGILAGFLTLIYVRRRRTLASAETLARHEPPGIFGPKYEHSIFGSTCRWLVVKSTHVAAVQSALDLHNPIPCSWGEGMSGLARRKLFVSPSIRGWILVVGQGLPNPSEDIDCCYHFVVKLSRALEQVQFFSVDRALNHHAWVWAEYGHVRRAYAWAGETLWNQGALTPAEIELGVKCLDYGERPEPIDSTSGATRPRNAEKVLLLASRWSFDPSTIDTSLLRVGLGVAGDLSHSRRH